MKTYPAIVFAGVTLVLAGCATKPSVETVDFNRSQIRPVLAETQLPPAAPGVYEVSRVDSPPAPLKYATTEVLMRAYDRRVFPLGSGSATVLYTVTEKGTVSDVSVYSASSRAYGEAAAAIVRGWKFKPAQKNGRPVACRTSWGLSLDFKPSGPMTAGIRPDYRGLGPVSQYDRAGY